MNNKYIPKLPNMIPMRDISDIEQGDRLFYEFGYKFNMMGGYDDNWIRTGQFIEINDIDDLLKNDKSILNIDYLVHHNFMLIKK